MNTNLEENQCDSVQHTKSFVQGKTIKAKKVTLTLWAIRAPHLALLLALVVY